MKGKLVLVCFIVFFLSGIVIGFLMGGYITQDKWNSFNEEREKEIERYCSCDYPETKEFIIPNINLSLYSN